MEAEHFVNLAIGAMGLVGVLAGVFWSKKRGPSSPERRQREDLYVDMAQTPGSPGTGDASTALDLAQYAVTEARGTTARLEAVERKLSRMQQAYAAAIGYIDNLHVNWPTLRQRDRPPPLPPEAHYTE